MLKMHSLAKETENLQDFPSFLQEILAAEPIESDGFSRCLKKLLEKSRLSLGVLTKKSRCLIRPLSLMEMID